jgi:hypothetical protein
MFIAIFSLLPPRDLPSVIRLSKVLQGIGRSLLYRSVDLRSDDIHIQSTVLLLQRDSELSQNIKRATLTTHWQQSSTTPWIPADFLNGWNNLRSLTMIGVPFRTINDQEIFRSKLMHSCTSLEHFAYRPGADLFRGPDFGISGLKRLSWQTEQASKWPFVTIFTTVKLRVRIAQARLEMQIISVMRSSMETLTHISFNGHLSLLEHNSCYYEFLDLRFPLLTSLELGSLFDTTSQEQSDTAITQFIIAHPNIHHLSLGKVRIGITSFQFDGTLLAEDSLPNLRSFEGFPMNITLLARSNVRCLPELTTLSLSSDLDDSSLEEMFETVKTRLGPGSGHFPCVQNLRFEFHTDLSHRMATHISDLVHRRWVDGFSEICPAVINWYGRLGPVNRVSSNSQGRSPPRITKFY